MGNYWTRPTVGINDIPDEVLADILNKLSLRDLKAAVLVSRLWRQEGESPHMWKSSRVQVRNREDVRNLSIRRLRLIEGIDLRPEGQWTDGDWDSFFLASLSLSRLKQIRGLHGNPLHSVDPSLLAKALVRLDVVDLRHTQITKDQVEELFQKVCQQEIGLTDASKATGQEQPEYQKIGLKMIILSGNDLSGVEAGLIGKAVSMMKEVYLRQTSLTEEQVQQLFTHMQQDTQLKALSLQSTNLSGVEPKMMGNAVSRMVSVNLCLTSLTEDQVQMIFGQMSQQTQLDKLLLGGNDLSSVEPAVLATVVTRISLVELILTKITDEQKVALLTAIGANDDIKLKKLDLSRNDLSTVEAHTLASAVHRLEVVKMEYTNLNIEQFNSIVNYQDEQSKLKTLSLWDPQKGENVNIDMHGGFLNGCNVM